MSGFQMISDQVRKQALEEFAPVIGDSSVAALGGLGYAQRTLEIAKGDYKASSIIGRVGPVGTSVEVIKDISEMEGRQIFNLIKNEQPQTISFVLSYLDRPRPRRSSALLSPTCARRSSSASARSRAPRSNSWQDRPQPRQAFRHQGAPDLPPQRRRPRRGRPAQRLDKEMSKGLLARLEERNAQLGAAIRKKMFSFEDLTASSRPICSACCARSIRPIWRWR
jgi:flagellar motor switch protein FliG